MLSIAEGCGFVAQVAKMRLFQTLTAALFAWLVLLSGFGLYANAATALATFAVGSLWIHRNFYHVIKAAIQCPDKSQQGNLWKDEILPMQWRIAISWLSGYFIFNLFNPVAFRFWCQIRWAVRFIFKYYYLNDRHFFVMVYDQGANLWSFNCR